MRFFSCVVISSLFADWYVQPIMAPPKVEIYRNCFVYVKDNGGAKSHCKHCKIKILISTSKQIIYPNLPHDSQQTHVLNLFHSCIILMHVVWTNIHTSIILED